jgi:hypothetical protein
LIRDSVPALLADGDFFVLYLDVEFDVFTSTVIVPGVLTMLHFLFLSMAVWCFLLLNRAAKRLLGGGEGGVKVKFKTFVL